MAGSARYTALLDANTLYPAPVRDLLMSLAVAGLYHARWTARIQDEWMRSLSEQSPHVAPRLARVAELMTLAVPDCLVENYEGLMDGISLPIRMTGMFWLLPSLVTPMRSSRSISGIFLRESCTVTTSKRSIRTTS